MNNKVTKIKELVFNFIYRLLIVALITIVLLIIMKKNINFKRDFYKYVYDTNFSFAKFNNLYNKYFKDFKTTIKDNSLFISLFLLVKTPQRNRL